MDPAITAFASAFAAVGPTAPTWCAGWNARETAAHVADDLLARLAAAEGKDLA